MHLRSLLADHAVPAKTGSLKQPALMQGHLLLACCTLQVPAALTGVHPSILMSQYSGCRRLCRAGKSAMHSLSRPLPAKHRALLQMHHFVNE